MTGELRYGRDLVQALVREQHPDLADRELREVPDGWDNHQWRLGPDLAVRLPRTERGPVLLRREQRWLPVLAEHLPLPVPVPVRLGEPSALFAHPWTIARWVEGDPADRAPITRVEAADTLADVLRALHRPAPAEAPTSPDRGVPLAALGEDFDRALIVLTDPALADEARGVWEAGVAAAAWSGAPLWLHGDLHPANVITRDGGLAGVIDFGDLCRGDPATDLSAAWVLLPDGAVARFVDRYGDLDEATVARARAWAVLRALHLLAIGRNGRLGRFGGKPTWEPAGRVALDRALTDSAA